MWDFTKQYALEVIINNRVVDEYPHTDGNTYIEGRPGSNYVLRIQNTSYEEILAIPAVDGLSIFDGNEAGLDSSGYVVSDLQTVDIPGWTLNTNEVAAFEFGDIKNSYAVASKKGTPNVGVIGLMIFRPKPLRFQATTFGNSQMRGIPISTSSYNCIETACESSANIPAQDIGTGFGKVKRFNTSKTTFDKRDPQNPDAIIALYYDSARGLERRGIKLGNTHNPSPFPTYANTQAGCTPPPGWVKK